MHAYISQVHPRPLSDLIGRRAVQLDCASSGNWLPRPTSLERKALNAAALRRVHGMASQEQPTAVQQAGPRQMLQLEDYTLPRWANALSAHVRLTLANKSATEQIWPQYLPVAHVPSCYGTCAFQAPRQRYALGIFPTPIHRWYPPGVPDGTEVYIKRDDLSGMQLSGNKVCSHFLTAWT